MGNMINKIILDGDMVLKAIEDTKRQLISALNNNPSDLEIEFRNVNKWDISGIRLMYAFKRYCVLMERNVSFKFASNEQAEITKEWIGLINKHL
jgi:hypothetical protein